MMTRSRVRLYEKAIGSVSVMVEEEYLKCYHIVDSQCLRKYNERNQHFSMEVSTINKEEEEERLIVYNCIYRYETHEVKLEYNISTEMWTLVTDKYHSEEKQLNTLIERINKFSRANMSSTLDQQIQYILKLFDGYFLEQNQSKKTERNTEKTSKSLFVFKKQNLPKCVDHELIELSSETPTSSTNSDDEKQESEEESNSSEKDTFDYDLHSSITGARPKFTDLLPPPVAPRRSRQNSVCSTQSSVRYDSFIPLPTASVRRRRVIESIILHVQRKKKTFEKIVDVLRGTEPPTMSELGLEFLRIYDGKFNYREGHTFVMMFRKKTWFLTIEQIKRVDCPVGDIGPRSELILSYKGHDTSVHI